MGLRPLENMSNGEVFFKNRVDFVYSYPIESTLPIRSILDGELIWEADCERGCFWYSML